MNLEISSQTTKDGNADENDRCKSRRENIRVDVCAFLPFSVKQRFVETIFVAVFFPFNFFLVNLEKQSLIHFEITELKGFLKYVCCANSQR